MTTLKVVAGSAGVGKSTRLINDALQAQMQMKTVFVMVPTNTAKDNLVQKVDELLAVEYQNPLAPKAKIKALEKLRYSIHVLYGYKGEDVVLIDEMSMINVPTLKALFWDTYFLPNIAITAYGDAKQLPSIKGNSMIEELLRLNVEGDLWSFVAEAYENVAFNVMTPPDNWRLEGSVEFETMLTNHRLNNLGFSGYNDEYIEALFNNAVDYSNDDTKDYSAEIIEAVTHYNLVICPTHDRGSEVNEYIESAYGERAGEVFPFVKQAKGTKVYLNPLHPNQDMLHAKFPFIKDLPANEDRKDLTLTAYVVVDVSQGGTVDDAVYFFGDKSIPSGKVQHFYSYNRIFTAITRSRNLTKLIGNAAEMHKQFDIHPVSAQQRLQHRTADVAVQELFNRLYGMDKELSIEDVYDMFMKLYEIVKPDVATMKELEAYNVVSHPYTMAQLVLKFKDYDTMQAIKTQNALNVVNYKAKFYDTHIKEANSQNGAKSAGKGKVQVWINSLDEAELAKVTEDVQTMSQRKFKEAYGKTQVTVKKALGL